MTKRKPSWFDRSLRAGAMIAGLWLLLPAGPAAAATSAVKKAPHATSGGKAKAGTVRPSVRHSSARPRVSREAPPSVGLADLLPDAGVGLRGSASFYGDKFQGRRTSSGERYDVRAFTAASNHFPLGSRVAVWRLDNGRCAVVRVNDRMHGSAHRIIDVSRGTAEYLQMLRAGVTMVRVAPFQGQGRDTAECRAAFETEDCASCASPASPRLSGQ